MISQPCRCVTFIEDCDSVVWNHEFKGKYLVQPRYVMASFRGFTPVYTPATWDIKIPHRVQITRCITTFWRRIIWVQGDVRKILLVCFVVNIRLCIIYSSLVGWLRMCGIIPEFLGLNIGTDLCEPWVAKKKHALNNIYSTHSLEFMEDA
jgi:hypothetical protein